MCVCVCNSNYSWFLGYMPELFLDKQPGSVALSSFPDSCPGEVARSGTFVPAQKPKPKTCAQ